MELLYDDSDIPTYLHYNGNGINPDLTLASTDIADDVERERPFRNRWNFAKADWKNFTLENETIFEYVSSFCKAGESVDRVFSRFVKIIFKTAKKWILGASSLTINPFGMKISLLLKEKSSTARFIAEQSKNPEDVQNWRKSVSLLRKEILTAKRNCFNNFITKIDYMKDGKKVMERMLTSRLDWYLKTNNLLTSSQAGFRKCQSTKQQVVFLGQSIKDTLD
ncbi:hypothetical protein TNCV_2535451 [Trichonephila clavipes]|nr:hypothetical protein TNCV_2535451 [Trichonephila clavipes]